MKGKIKDNKTPFFPSHYLRTSVKQKQMKRCIKFHSWHWAYEQAQQNDARCVEITNGRNSIKYYRYETRKESFSISFISSYYFSKEATHTLWKPVIQIVVVLVQLF